MLPYPCHNGSCSTSKLCIFRRHPAFLDRRIYSRSSGEVSFFYWSRADMRKSRGFECDSGIEAATSFDIFAVVAEIALDIISHSPTIKCVPADALRCQSRHKALIFRQMIRAKIYSPSCSSCRNGSYIRLQLRGYHKHDIGTVVYSLVLYIRIGVVDSLHICRGNNIGAEQKVAASNNRRTNESRPQSLRKTHCRSTAWLLSRYPAQVWM